ncbi:MAG: hypothetical protein AAF656_14310 [Planctomycetota bacterium]
MDRKLLHLDFGRGKLRDGNRILDAIDPASASDELKWALEDFASALGDLADAIRQSHVDWMYDCIDDAEEIARDIEEILNRGQS